MDKLFALVSKASSVVHQRVIQSVSAILSVHKTKHAQIRNVAILVQEHVDQERNVRLYRIHQFVVVQLDILVIHLYGVNQLLILRYVIRLIHVIHLRVVQIHNVNRLENHHHVHVYPNSLAIHRTVVRNVSVIQSVQAVWLVFV